MQWKDYSMYSCTIQDFPHAPLETLQDSYKPSKENSETA